MYEVRSVIMAVKLANFILFRNFVHFDDGFEGIANLEIYESVFMVDQLSKFHGDVTHLEVP